MAELNNFIPSKEYVVCIDSDGCAMDSMDIKHKKCFGPCMITEWNLEEWQDAILDRWNVINLYSKTRGINRFKGLAMALKEIDKSYKKINGVEALCKWAENAPELSNPAIEKMISENPIFEKALNWSKEVNRNINLLTDKEKQPFDNALETIAALKEKADIVIVSSANREAVNEEWKLNGFMEYVDCVCAQDTGSKAFCISKLVEKGYAKNKILMCGDAPGDLDAAEKNGVLYYPILVQKEAKSWKELKEIGASKFFNLDYEKGYGEEKKREFWKNLE